MTDDASLLIARARELGTAYGSLPNAPVKAQTAALIAAFLEEGHKETYDTFVSLGTRALLCRDIDSIMEFDDALSQAKLDKLVAKFTRLHFTPQKIQAFVHGYCNFKGYAVNKGASPQPVPPPRHEVPTPKPEAPHAARDNAPDQPNVSHVATASSEGVSAPKSRMAIYIPAIIVLAIVLVWLTVPLFSGLMGGRGSADTIIAQGSPDAEAPPAFDIGIGSGEGAIDDFGTQAFISFLTNSGYAIMASETHSHNLDIGGAGGGYEALPTDFILSASVIGMKYADFDGNGTSEMLVVLSEWTDSGQQRGNSLTALMLREQGGTVAESARIDLAAFNPGNYSMSGYIDVFVKYVEGRYVISVQQDDTVAEGVWGMSPVEMSLRSYMYTGGAFTELLYMSRYGWYGPGAPHFDDVTTGSLQSAGFVNVSHPSERALTEESGIEVVTSIEWSAPWDVIWDEVAELREGNRQGGISPIEISITTSNSRSQHVAQRNIAEPVSPTSDETITLTFMANLDRPILLTSSEIEQLIANAPHYTHTRQPHPDRRMTATELESWIQRYNEMGGMNAQELELLLIINNIRAEHNLPPFILCLDLSMASRLFSYLQVKYHTSGHTDRHYGDFGSRMDLFCQIEWTRAFENANSESWTQYRDGSGRIYDYLNPQELVDGWMSSPGHRNHILTTETTHIGFGVDSGNNRVVPTMKSILPINAPQHITAPIIRAQPTQGQSHPATAEGTVSDTQFLQAWQEAYANFLRHPSNFHGDLSLPPDNVFSFGFALHDFTQDGIPELLVYYEGVSMADGSGFLVYTFDGTEMRFLDEVHTWRAFGDAYVTNNPDFPGIIFLQMHWGFLEIRYSELAGGRANTVPLLSVEDYDMGPTAWEVVMRADSAIFDAWPSATRLATHEINEHNIQRVIAEPNPPQLVGERGISTPSGIPLSYLLQSPVLQRQETPRPAPMQEDTGGMIPIHPILEDPGMPEAPFTVRHVIETTAVNRPTFIMFSNEPIRIEPRVPAGDWETDVVYVLPLGTRVAVLIEWGWETVGLEWSDLISLTYDVPDNEGGGWGGVLMQTSPHLTEAFLGRSEVRLYLDGPQMPLHFLRIE